jgi:hypothetical protein
MTKDMESELIGNEITYLKPRISKARAFAEAVAGALLIAGFVYFLLWIAAATLPRK